MGKISSYYQPIHNENINYFLPVNDKNPIETSDIITRTAPIIVTVVPENSLPNSNPNPNPPIIPIPNPLLFIVLTSNKFLFSIILDSSNYVIFQQLLDT